MKQRSNFGSKIGAILVAAGSAVGLGNIWRFPTEAGNNGGGAFLIIYIICVLAVCIPLLLAEFLIGRHSHANTGSAYKILSPNKHWGFIGKIEVCGAFLILSYYSVVAGWTLFYMVQSMLNQFNTMAKHSGSEQIFSDNFNNFVSNPWQPLLRLSAYHAFCNSKRRERRHRKIGQAPYAFSFRAFGGANGMLVVNPRCGQRFGIPVCARFFQDKFQSSYGSNGAVVLFHEFGNGLYVHVCLLFFG